MHYVRGQGTECSPMQSQKAKPLLGVQATTTSTLPCSLLFCGSLPSQQEPPSILILRGKVNHMVGFLIMAASHISQRYHLLSVYLTIEW